MKLLNKILQRAGLRLSRLNSIMTIPLDENGVEILKDESFFRSCNEVKKFTLLDTNRLINLWEYCKRSNPDGAIVEIGSYRGGGALHLSNAQPGRPIFIFDSFKGFQQVDRKLDANFNMSQFKDTSIGEVAGLFVNKNRKFEIIDGFFPQSAGDRVFPGISFVHLDVDIYKATIESLQYLDNKMLDHSFILIDDYNRSCEGVNKAVAEFIAQTGNWRAFPLFPSQALLVHRTWFDGQQPSWH